MADPIRRRIVQIVAVGENPSSWIIEAIQREFGVTSAAVSHHLRVLRETRFVDVRHDDNMRLYALSEHGIEALHDEVKQLRTLWKQRLGWRLPGDPMFAGVQPYRRLPHAPDDAALPGADGAVAAVGEGASDEDA